MNEEEMNRVIRIPIINVEQTRLYCRLHENDVIMCVNIHQVDGYEGDVFDLSESFCPGFGVEVKAIDTELMTLTTSIMTPHQYAWYKRLFAEREQKQQRCYDSWELVVDSLTDGWQNTIDETITKILEGGNE